VWLFSSGPIGEPAKPADNPVDVTKILQATKARDHQIFTGKLTRQDLSFPDRAIVSAIRAQEGDFRNWAEIRDWATGIADALLS
jgi:menaquinone-dependent protoporphyrinogen oxidase